MLLRRSVSGDIYAFAPKAPSIFIPEDERGLFLEDLSENLKPFLPKETVCIRYDTFWPSSFEDADNMPRKELLEMRFNFGTKKHLLRKSTSDHFCPNTVLIDLSASPEQMLTRMRQTTRNSIRKSYREGVTFSEKDLSFLPVWHNLYKKTGLRKKFYTEEKDYFEMLLGGARRFGRLFFKPVASPHEDCGKGPPEKQVSSAISKILSSNPSEMPCTAPVPEPTFHILAAEKDGGLLASIILCFCGKTAYYMYSGSDPEYSKYMGGYGLQWEAMLYARKNGCQVYDLVGIPPNGQKNHPMSGLYTFKTGFGGKKVKYAGCWDYPFNQGKYTRFCNSEELRQK